MVQPEREHWRGRIDFVLACIGYCVGVGNIWRFPYLCFIHGGSAFLIPYIIMTVLVSLPLFFMELSVGQFTSQGPITAWGMTPLLSAIKNEACVERVSDELGIGSSKVQIENKFLNDYSSFESNYSHCNIKYTLPSQEYWKYFILGMSDSESISSIGSLVGRNTVFLLLAWIVIFVCIIRGPQSIAKVVYFTATYPLGILIVFLIRGVNTTGYNDGIDYYAVPKWDKLLDTGVWGAAATQVLYSVGIAFGGLLTFSSYNKFNNNIFRDSIIVVSINAGSSIFAGFVTFALIGSISHETNRPVTELVESGHELVFVIYPQGLSSLPSPAIWSFLYFMMAFTLGLDSQFGMMETVIVGFTDRFPDTIGKHRKKFVLLCCVLGFLLGIPLTAEGGIYILNLMDFYSASYSLMILALVELIMIAWIYGVKNFVRDLELMLGKQSRVFWLYWIAMWLVITPIIIVLMFIMAMYSYEPAKYDGKAVPTWAELIGWLMVVIPILCVIARAGKMVVYNKIPIMEALKPAKTYVPRHELNPETLDANTETKIADIARDHNEAEIQEVQGDGYLNPVHVENEVEQFPNTNVETISLSENIRNIQSVDNREITNDIKALPPHPCVPPQNDTRHAKDKTNDNY